VSGRYALLYDGDCGFCKRSLGWVLRWDRRGALEPVALQDERADELLAGLAPAERMKSWHLVSPSGKRWSAGAAAPPLLRLLPGGRPLAAILALAPRTTDRVYRFIARHRGTIGRLLG
jgi:predicted DCC family thiol-disulfide oxidoreductase YuxK